ncbi:hypothetical protein Tco_0509937, partial [Tanacetum coccineum]
VALEDLLKRANTEFSNDEKVIELYEKYERLFKEAVFSEDSQAHLDILIMMMEEVTMMMMVPIMLRRKRNRRVRLL